MPSSGNLAISITIKNAYATIPFLAISKSTMELTAPLLLGAENWEAGSYPLIKDRRSRALGQCCVYATEC